MKPQVDDVNKYEMLQKQYAELQSKMQQLETLNQNQNQNPNQNQNQGLSNQQLAALADLVEDNIKGRMTTNSEEVLTQDVLEIDPMKDGQIKRLCQAGINMLRNELKDIQPLSKLTLLDWKHAFRNFGTMLNVAAVGVESYQFTSKELLELKAHGVNNESEARVCLKHLIEELHFILRPKLTLEFISSQKILGMEVIDIAKVLNFINGEGPYALQADEIIRDAFELYNLTTQASARFEDPVDLGNYINSIRNDKMYYKQVQVAHVWLNSNIGVIQTYGMVRKTSYEDYFFREVGKAYQEVLNNNTLMDAMTTVVENTPNAFETILKSIKTFRTEKINSKYRRTPYTGLLNDSLKNWRAKLPPLKTSPVSRANTITNKTSTPYEDKVSSPLNASGAKVETPITQTSRIMSYSECCTVVTSSRKEAIQVLNMSSEIKEAMSQLPPMTIDTRFEWQHVLKFMYCFLDSEKEGKLNQRIHDLDSADKDHYRKLGLDSYVEMLYADYHVMLTIEKIIISKVPKRFVNKDNTLKLKPFINFAIGYGKYDIPWKTVMRDTFEINDMVMTAVNKMTSLYDICEFFATIRNAPLYYVKLVLFDLWLHINFGLIEVYHGLKHSGKELYFMDTARKVFEEEMEEPLYRARFLSMLIYPRNALDQIIEKLNDDDFFFNGDEKIKPRPPYKSHLSQSFLEWGNLLIRGVTTVQQINQRISLNNPTASSRTDIFQPPIIITPAPNDTSYFYDTWSNPNPYYFPILSSTPVGPYPGVPYETTATGLLPYPGGIMGAIDPNTTSAPWVSPAVNGVSRHVLWSQNDAQDPGNVDINTETVGDSTYADEYGAQYEGDYSETYGADNAFETNATYDSELIYESNPAEFADSGFSETVDPSGGDFGSSVDISGCTIM